MGTPIREQLSGLWLAQIQKMDPKEARRSRRVYIMAPSWQAAAETANSLCSSDGTFYHERVAALEPVPDSDVVMARGWTFASTDWYWQRD